MSSEESSQFSLCVVVPTFNEEEGLLAFYRELLDVIEKYDYNVIFVDDGSTDKTLEIIKSICLIDNRIKYISFSRNFGHQNALKAGYDHAVGDCIVCLDADLQHPPPVIDLLIEKWQEGHEIVYTVRKEQMKIPLLKRITATTFYWFLNKISKVKLVPNASDFRLIDKKVLSVVQSFDEENIFIRGLIAWAGFSQCGISFNVDVRAFGSSKYSLRKMFSLSISGITSFSINPLRVALVMGLMFAILSFFYGFYAIYVHVYTNQTIPGWTSLIVCFLFVSGLQFILIGIIGEYLGKSFLEAKKRPKYLVKSHNISVVERVFERYAQ
jgi:glycosyltransferase involved in cell wall biosynthesis